MGSNDNYGCTLVTIAANVVEVGSMEEISGSRWSFYRHIWSPSQRQVCLEEGSFSDRSKILLDILSQKSLRTAPFSESFQAECR